MPASPFHQHPAAVPLSAPSLSLDALAAYDAVDPIDVETARLMRRLDPNDNSAPSSIVEHSTLLLSAQRRAGASCVRLEDWAGHPFPEPEDPADADGPRLPAVADWRTQLEASALVGRGEALASGGAAPTPMVLDGSEDGSERLYLHRWWHAEQTVARLLKARLEAEPIPLPEAAREAFAHFFETKSDDTLARGQAVAAAGALFSPLTVVTGGPGTGKTYAAARLLALLLTADPSLNVALAAPTGKAAKRLGASIGQEAAALDLPDAVRAALPTEAQTLHRLLGYQPRANRFRFHAERPLDLDAVLVDESSMIDLLLFQALLEALPERARLVFLGDEHQLASIAAGRVLADLAALKGTGRSPAFARHCRRLGAGRVPVADRNGPPLRDAAVTLRENHRFGEDSGVAALAAAVRDGKSDRAVRVLRSDAHPEVRLVPASERNAVLGEAVAHARALCQAKRPTDALTRKAQFQVLAATYHGPQGVHAANRFVEDALLRSGDRPAGRFYPGRLVLVTANDYEQDLFNGDLGVCVASGGQLQVHFDSPDGSTDDDARATPRLKGGSTLRGVAPARLPQHESAWAVTVHKSQGSEYDQVVLLLPDEMQPPLCRALVYTAVTRAKERVTVVGPEAVLRESIATPERRPSGLPDAVSEARTLQTLST